MEHSQVQFIESYISHKISCITEEKKPSQVLVKTVLKILTEKYMYGADMKALECLVETALYNSSDDKTVKPYTVNSSINYWFTKMKLLDVESSEGAVYFTSILDDTIQMVAKISRYEGASENLKQEYYLGSACFNDLRYYIPNFSYTLGCFNEGRGEFFAAFEKIPGFTTGSMVSKVSTDQVIGFVAQLLLALEVAQMKCNFTHWDLHNENVIWRPVKNYTNYVVYGDSVFKVQSNDYIPVIIDYGMSCATNSEGVNIGCLWIADFGLKNFIVPAFDAIKAIMWLKIPQIVDDLMEFFGVENASAGFSVFASTFGAHTCSADYAYKTPMMMLRWLLKHEKYGRIAGKYIQEIPRENAPNCTNSCMGVSGIYNSMFKNSKGMTVEDTIYQCIKPTQSYTYSMYNIHFLKECLKESTSSKIRRKLVEIQNSVNSNLKKMIDYDHTVISNTKPNYFYPEVFDGILDKVTAIKLTDVGTLIQSKEIENLNTIFGVVVTQFDDIAKFYYATRELRITQFDDILIPKLKALKFFEHQSMLQDIEAVRRWLFALKQESIRR